MKTVDGKPMLIMLYALDSNDMKLWTAPALNPADGCDVSESARGHALAGGGSRVGHAAGQLLSG